jgi:intracellular septation protein A
MTQLPPATEIVQGLVWLGSAKDANDEVFLTRNGIQNVLNTAIEVPENQWTSLKIHA